MLAASAKKPTIFVGLCMGMLANLARITVALFMDEEGLLVWPSLDVSGPRYGAFRLGACPAERGQEQLHGRRVWGSRVCVWRIRA